MWTLTEDAAHPAHDAFVERKSEFIGDACHIATLGEALEVVETIRQMHPKARHVAYAAICGGADGALSERMSDDGEPSGTAGKPILDVLRAQELTDCVVAVTRYFGGVLLGSGGLIRAYATGAAVALKAAHKALIVPCQQYRLSLDYAQLGSMQYVVASVDGVQEAVSYGADVELTVSVPMAAADMFVRKVREGFHASVTPQPLGVVARPVPVEAS